jgi:topoisomerase-4 subunit B
VLLRVEIAEDDELETRHTIERLMGTKAESRFRFIQERAPFVEELDV